MTPGSRRDSEIAVDGEPGGTTVTVTLPAVTAEVRGPGPAPGDVARPTARQPA